MFSIDWIMKGVVFDSGSKGQTQANWGIIGFRSYAHYNTTVLSALNLKLPLWFNIIIDWLILLGFLILPYFLTTKNYFLITTAIISAGVLGNSLDRMVYKYVRDVLFTPWADKGTFNFADVLLVGGAIAYAMFSMYDLYIEFKNEKKQNETQVINLSDKSDENTNLETPSSEKETVQNVEENKNESAHDTKKKQQDTELPEIKDFTQEDIDKDLKD